MRIDNIYLLYENSNKIFPTYNEAYFNGKKVGLEKTVYYIFTPTMRKFKYVKDLYKHSQEYFKNSFDTDYLDIISKRMYKQLKLC